MLGANTNNRASTVLALFLRAVKEWGIPSRVRGDRGGENIDIAVWITKYRGAGRASFVGKVRLFLSLHVVIIVQIPDSWTFVAQPATLGSSACG